MINALSVLLLATAIRKSRQDSTPFKPQLGKIRLDLKIQTQRDNAKSGYQELTSRSLDVGSKLILKIMPTHSHAWLPKFKAAGDPTAEDRFRT